MRSHHEGHHGGRARRAGVRFTSGCRAFEEFAAQVGGVDCGGAAGCQRLVVTGWLLSCATRLCGPSVVAGAALVARRSLKGPVKWSEPGVADGAVCFHCGRALLGVCWLGLLVGFAGWVCRLGLPVGFVGCVFSKGPSVVTLCSQAALLSSASALQRPGGGLNYAAPSLFPYGARVGVGRLIVACLCAEGGFAGVLWLPS
jgi:hypothetical protein